MEASTSKRNGPTLSKAYKQNLRKKLVRYVKKAELRNSTNETINKESTSTLDANNDNGDNRDEEIIEIFYNPDKVSI
jgi:hypothetical protein